MTKSATLIRHTFIEFMVRDGFDRKQASHEFDNFLTVNGQIRLRDSYLMMSRLGATLSLNREARAKVYMTFENALNHASFCA